MPNISLLTLNWSSWLYLWGDESTSATEDMVWDFLPKYMQVPSELTKTETFELILEKVKQNAPK